ncbi:MAG: amidohydrolase family protein [Acetobacteraceae bacterium]|nr:amidohydrolase family protein [Acetobacteraceae bacterium]
MEFDLLIEGVTLIPSAFEPPMTDACVGITEGRFTHVGGALPDAVARRRLRRPGHLALPGLVNTHLHAALVMVRGTAEDMGFAPSYTRGVPQGHHLTTGEAVALARLGALEALLAGCTTVNDVYVHARHTMPELAAMGLRVHGCQRIHDVDFDAVLEGRWEHRQEIGEFHLAEAAAMIEGLHGRGLMRVQIAPHAPDTCTTPLLGRVRELAERHGLSVQTHLCQSHAELARLREREGCTPVEYLEELGLLHDRLVAAHCIHVTADDIARIGAARVHVAHIPRNNAVTGRYAPTRALVEAGARLTLCTDNRHGDLIEAMRWGLAMGRIQAGRVDEAWQPEHMLHAATEAGAAALDLGGELGAVREGWLADLVLVDLRRPHLVPHNDPLGTLVHTGMGRDVTHVIVNGEVVVEDGQATRCDAAGIMREGAAAAAAIWARAA